MSAHFEPVRSNLGKQVYEHIRDQIYQMDIEPGTHLGISETAEQLRVSRSPVRDAFLILVADGIVEPIPSGYRVIQFDRKYITDVFIVRRALELTSVRLSIENFDRQRVEQLRQVWEQFRTVDESDPDFLERHLKADSDLHQSIADMSQNVLLKQSLHKIISVAALIRRWQYAGGDPYRQLVPSAEEHLKVLDAILAHDTDAAVAALDEHLTLAHNRSLARLNSKFHAPDHAGLGKKERPFPGNRKGG